jgi:hypothetical protein
MVINPNDAEKQKGLQKFEKDHAGHGLLTMELEEAKNRYENVSFFYSAVPDSKATPL